MPPDEEDDKDDESPEPGGTTPEPIVDQKVKPGSFDEFDLLGVIGQGGMGVIYRARERSLDRVVALKLIKNGSLATPADIDRFRTEASAAARLKHQHIVGVYGVGEFEGQHYYSMEYVAGHSLAEELRAGPLQPRRAAELLRKVALAIQFAHANKILHRDLKPANILLDQEGEPRVADFGLAKNLLAQSEHSLDGSVMGSPHYMPPEQAAGRSGDVTFEADVYSLGAILFDMLTGRPPFSGATALETMRLVIEQEPVAPRALNPAVPLDLETICLKCLAKETKRRYHTAQELADELGNFLEGLPIRARRVSPFERGWRWCRRKPTLAALAGLTAIAPIVVIVIMYVDGVKIAAESRRLAAQTYGADVALADRSLADRDYGAANWALAGYAPAALAGVDAPGAPGFEWRWLWQNAQGEARRSVVAHRGKVTSLSFSPNGARLVSGSDDGSALLWDPIQGRLLRRFAPPPRRMSLLSGAGGAEAGTAPMEGISPSFTADGKSLLVGDSGGFAFWSLRDWQCRLNFGSNHIINPLCSPTDPNLMVAMVVEREKADHSLAFFDVAGGRFTNSFQGMDVQTFCFTPDGRKVAYWDFRSGAIAIQSVQGEKTAQVVTTGNQSDIVLDMTFTRDGQTLVVGRTLPGRVDLYDVSNQKLLETLQSGAGRLGAMAISADGQWLATGGADQSICLWQLHSPRMVVRRLWGHAGTVSALAFSPDSQQLVSGGWDGTVRFWEVSPAPPPPNLTNVAGCFAFSGDGRQLVTQGTNGMARLWELPERKLLAEWSMPTFRSAVIVPGGKLVLAGMSELKNLACSWTFDLATKRLEGPLWIADIGFPCTTVALSPDGEYLATGHRNGVVALWRVRDGKMLEQSKPGMGEGVARSPITGLNFSANHQRLVAFCKKSSSLIASAWEIPGLTRSAIRSFDGAEIKFALSPDGERFAVSGKDQPLGIKFWQGAGKENEIGLQGNVGIPRALAFSADGRTLASGEDFGLIKLWHLESRRAVATLGTLNSDVIMSQFIFSGDGTWLGMSDSTGELHLFHAPPPSRVTDSGLPE